MSHGPFLWHTLDYSNAATEHASDEEIMAALDPGLVGDIDKELSDVDKISLSSLVTLASQYRAMPNVFDEEYEASFSVGPYNIQQEYKMNPNVIITSGNGLSSGGTVSISTTELNSGPDIVTLTKNWGKREDAPTIQSPERDEPVPNMAELAAMLKVRPLKDPMTELAALGTDGHYYDLMEIMTAHTKLMLLMMEKTTKKW